MTLADKLITEARTWRGTRFQHQGRLKGTGVDCVGFIAGVARNTGISIDIPADYRSHEDGLIMLRLLREHLDLVEDMQAGDIVALCDEALQNTDIPRHVVIVTEVKPYTAFIIHASRMGVVEHRIDSGWRRRIHSVWRLKDSNQNTKN